MALSDTARNALRNAVQRMREKLTTDLADRLVGTYGVQRDGTFQPVSKLPALERDARARETRELLERILQLDSPQAMAIVINGSASAPRRGPPFPILLIDPGRT